jgi:2-oxoglutarate dehydrogenase complex dehydrogenase (E1) component-like enzyme
MQGFLADKTTWTLREIMQKLQGIYSDKMGIEFMHISNLKERSWIMHQFEKISTEPTPKEEKLKIL